MLQYRVILWALLRSARDLHAVTPFQRMRKTTLDKLLRFLLMRRMRRMYPQSQLLRTPLVFPEYLADWQRHLNLVVHTPFMRAMDGLSIFRTYRFQMDPEVESALTQRKPIVLCTYHRSDLADLFGSLILFLHRRPDDPPPRIVAMRLDELSFREAIWSLFGDLFGIEINILCTKSADFARRLKQEFDHGAMIIYMCDMPLNGDRSDHDIEREFLGLPSRLDMGLLKLALGKRATIAWLSPQGADVQLEYIRPPEGTRATRFAALKEAILERVSRDSQQDAFRWVGWLEHTHTKRHRSRERQA